VYGNNDLYGATSEGLIHYNFEGFPTLIPDVPTDGIHIYNKLLKMVIDSKQTLYVQTQDNKIFSYNTTKSKWGSKSLSPGEDKLRDFIIVEENDGQPWLWLAVGDYLNRREVGAESVDIWLPLYLENVSLLAIGNDGLIYSSGFDNTGYFDEYSVWHRIPELNNMQATVAAFYGEERMAVNSAKIVPVLTGESTIHSGVYTYTTDDTVTVQEKPIAAFSLLINHPNPFNDTTAITFELPETERVRIDVYSVTGQLIRHLVDKRFAPGINTIHWDALSDSNEHVSSGLYLYHVTAGQRNATGKMLLLR
jgi:hypothetical protein